MILNQISKNYLLEVAGEAFAYTEHFNVNDSSRFFILIDGLDTHLISSIMEKPNQDFFYLKEQLFIYLSQCKSENSDIKVIAIAFDDTEDMIYFSLSNVCLHFNDNAILNHEYSSKVSENTLFVLSSIALETLALENKVLKDSFEPNIKDEIYIWLNFISLENRKKLFTKMIDSKLINLLNVEEILEKKLIEEKLEETLIDSILLVNNELLLNAYEYGVLELSGELKHLLLERGEYEAYCKKEEDNNDKKTILCELFEINHGIFMLSINDFGNGFDVESLLNKPVNQGTVFHGRGVQMISMYSSALFFEKSGSIVKALFLSGNGE
jgi:hypothetical protein